uniref:Peritrophin-44 n=1 Tax=Zeugodacus cucurbitae TaxID=28588 RepID=A0A0A1XJW9_ZEUCU
MEGLRRMILVTLLFGIFNVVHCAEVLSPENDICRLFKDGVILRKPGFCNMGVKCQGFKSTEFKDCKQQFYNRNSGKCEKSSADKYCKSPCSAESQGFIKDGKNCQGWYKCEKTKTISFGVCVANLVFNTDDIKCDYPENFVCEENTFDFCDVVPDGTPFLDETNCGTYNECVKGKLVVKDCDTGKFFDVKTGTCILKRDVKCEKYPYPKDVCGNQKLAIRNRFVSDNASCRGYFFCKDQGIGQPDKSPRWGQCPVATFFDPKEEACLPRTYVRCTEDRCDGRKDGYELSSKSGCQHYLKCKDNRTVEELYCGNNNWFNAEKNICITTATSYPVCAKFYTLA